MKRLDHGMEFKTGHRVLILKARHKDGFTVERQITRYTHGAVEFQKALDELYQLSVEGERIYASLAPRDFFKATQTFKHRILEADAMPPLEQQLWWANIKDRWISALMKPENVVKSEKLWLIDCDTHGFYCDARIHLRGKQIRYYEYATKNGWHLVISPTNRAALYPEVNAAIDMNPMMLWAY